MGLSGLGAAAGLAAPGSSLASVFRGSNGEPATSRFSMGLAHWGGHPPPLEPRHLAFRNLHTEETLEVAYWREGAYDPEALKAIDNVLRDFRTGDVYPIAPRLLDVLFDLRARTRAKGAIQVISGYRSPKTNEDLREKSAQVAKRSFHVDGKAIDLYLDGVDLVYLRNAALDLSRGGVGYYPDSKFVHVDIGPLRHWVGS
jgi:uncharacterized protein YcbK (DUF882 family)